MYEVEMHKDAAEVILLNLSWFHHLLYFEEVRGVNLLFRITLDAGNLVHSFVLKCKTDLNVSILSIKNGRISSRTAVALASLQKQATIRHTGACSHTLKACHALQLMNGCFLVLF